VLALLLYLWLGPRAASIELMAELLICLGVIGGGGGTRVRRTLRGLLPRLRRRELGDVPPRPARYDSTPTLKLG
jgi:hypothetical protein